LTCNFQAGLAISSPYGSPFTFDPSGSNPANNLLGVNTDETYFEYLFTLNNVTCAENTICNTYAPASIRVSGEEQYFTLWICDSSTSRISVRNSSGQFKVGETVTAANGATGTVKEWHNFREPGGLDIIELDSPSGNFPGETVTGSESSATADCVAGWFDTPGTQNLGGGNVPVTTETVVASLSGFYAYPKKVSYTKYLRPKCDTLTDICGEIGSYDDQTDGWMEMFERSGGDCESKALAEAIREASTHWGTKEETCTRESTWPINADTGVYVKVPLLGVDDAGNNIELREKSHKGLQAQLETNWNAWFDAAMGCNAGFHDEQHFRNLFEGLSSPTSLEFNRDYVIDSAADTYVVQTDGGLESDLTGSAEMWREVRTFNCEMNEAIDMEIAMAEYREAIFKNQKTVIPSDWYVEKMQEWTTHSFRGVPSPGPSIRWNIFEYVPHSRGRENFVYTITGSWYCSDLMGTNIGGTISHTYTIGLELNSNWSTYRDLLAEAVERQGNPYDDILIAQIRHFVKPTDDSITLYDYDIDSFPDYGYLELNNYEYAGQGISEITALDPGLGYMSIPNVTVGPPDLDGGVNATVEPIVTGGRIYGYNVTNTGSGYIQSPEIIVDAPNPVLTGTADVEVGSSFMINIDMPDYPLLFMGVTVQDDLGQMDVRQVKRLIPSVDFQCTADGSNQLVVNTVYWTEEGFDLDDIQAGMLIEGFDDPTIYVQQVTLSGSIIQVSANIPAGTYRVNTKTAIQMDTASTVTLNGADFTFTAPQSANATAYTRIFLQAETGSSFTYENSREIAHFDGKTLNEDGSVTLNTLLRTRKETEAKQHLRNDHTFLHIYV
tara:strand:- start:8547 stop:11054 length:2508 start_codon:yes stop_codon:yes gene_type:complete